MDKKKLIIIIGSVILALIIAGIIIIIQTCKEDEEEAAVDELNEINTSLSAAEQRRLNTLKLAENYALAGEYDRALNLIDGILIENPDDQDALSLQRIILSMDRSGGTDALLEAQRLLLEQQTRAISNLNRNPPSSSATTSPAQSSHSQPSGPSAAQIAAEAAARRAAEEDAAAKRAAAEAEAAAIRKAAEESLQAAAGASHGQSLGAESVQSYENIPDID